MSKVKITIWGFRCERCEHKWVPREIEQEPCQVSDSYIGKLRSGRSDNLTVQTILTLAKGLEVNPHDIFTVVSGVAVAEAANIDPLVLLEQMQRLIHNPRGFEVLQRWSQLPPEKQQQLFDLIDILNQPPAKAKKRSRKNN